MRDDAAYADDPYGPAVSGVSISEIVARAIAVGRIEIQVQASSWATKREWQQRLDVAQALLVEALAARHVYTWPLIQTEYRHRASFEIEDALEEMNR